MSKLRVTRADLPAGGGAYKLDALTVGVFQGAQPNHRLSVGSDKAAHAPLAAQEGWVMPAGAEGLCTYDTPMEILTISIEAGLLEEMGLSRLAGAAPHAGAFDPMTLQLLLGAEGFEAGGTLYRETMTRALVAQLGASLAPDPVPQIEDKRMSRVVQAIRDDPGADHGLDALADLAGLSPYHFARAFKATTGASPLQYVIAQRIELAQVLLKATSLPVAEIAYRAGYEDVARFTRQFKARVGTTPGRFRSA